MTPEAKVKNAIRNYLKSLGSECWFFFPSSNGMGRSGIPDIIVSYQGHFFAIEVKAPGKTSNTTSNQDREIDSINASLGTAMVADNMEDVKHYIETFDRNYYA